MKQETTYGGKDARPENPAKTYLRRYVWLKRQRDAIADEIRDHYASATRCTTRMNPIRSSGGTAYDRMAEDVVRIADASARLEALERDIDRQLSEILDLIACITDERHKAVLTYRYIRGMSWEDIMEAMGYERTQIYVLHGYALKEANELLKERTKTDY